MIFKAKEVLPIGPVGIDSQLRLLADTHLCNKRVRMIPQDLADLPSKPSTIAEAEQEEVLVGFFSNYSIAQTYHPSHESPCLHQL